MQVNLQTRTQQALDEIRMLVLGLQVLLGFTLQAFLMPSSFVRAASGVVGGEVPYLMLLSLAAFLGALILLFVPPAHHRLVERGEASEGTLMWARRMMSMSFLLSVGA